MRIWLDKIGLKKKDRPEGWNKPFSRRVKCKVRKWIYGVDPRETYALDFAWHMWLYEHLKMFLEQADPVVVLDEKNIEWDSGTWSIRDLILMMLQRLEFVLNPESGYNDFDEKDVKYARQIEEIWAAVCPYMWW